MELSTFVKNMDGRFFEYPWCVTCMSFVTLSGKFEISGKFEPYARLYRYHNVSWIGNTCEVNK